MGWVRGSEHQHERRRDCLGVFGAHRDCLGKFGKYINHGENVLHSTVVPGDTLHIGQVGLPLGIDPRHIGVVPGEPTARRLVQRIGLLAPDIFLDRILRDTWDIKLPRAPQQPLNTAQGSWAFNVVRDFT